MAKFYIAKSDKYDDWVLSEADGVPILTADTFAEMEEKINERAKELARIPSGS